MGARAWWLILVAVASALAVPVPLHAADPAAAESLFQKGKALMRQGQLEDACQAFEASMKAEASGGTLLNLALCHERRGMTATAWAEYKRAVPIFRQAGEPKREQAARELAAKLEPTLSKLTIVVIDPVAGLTVTRNGVPVGEAYFGTAVAIDPGSYEIEARAAGYEGWSTAVRIGADGDGQTVRVPALQPASVSTAAAAPDGGSASVGSAGTSPLLVAGVVIGSAGVIVAAIGGVMGGMVLSDASDAESDPALCPDQVCTPEGREAIDSAEGKAMIANVMIPVGAAAAVGGVVMMLLGVGAGGADGGEAARPFQLVPLAGPGSGGLQLQICF